MYHCAVLLMLLGMAFPQPLGGVAPLPPSVERSTFAVPTRQDGYVDAGGGVRLYYRVIGRATPDTILVLHGGPGLSSSYIADDIAPVATRYTLIFFDQRGSGRSTLVSDSVALTGERFADDVDAVRRHFRLDRVTLLGHSWGSTLAAMFAIRYPERVRSMLLVGSMAPTRTGNDEVLKNIRAARDTAGQRRLREARTVWYADTASVVKCRAFQVEWFQPFFADPAILRRSRGEFCDGTPEALKNAEGRVGRFTVPSLGDWDWRSALRSVKARTLVLHGTLDVIPPGQARVWAESLPNARLVLFEGVGHFPYLEAPEQFGRALDAFMAGNWPPQAIEPKP